RLQVSNARAGSAVSSSTPAMSGVLMVLPSSWGGRDGPPSRGPVLLLHLTLVALRLDDETGRVGRVLARRRIRRPVLEARRGGDVVAALVEGVGRILARVHVRLRRGRVPADVVTVGEVWEGGPTGRAVQRRGHQLAAALELEVRVRRPAHGFERRVGIVDGDIGDQLAADFE